jgi:hypothetical protein
MASYLITQEELDLLYEKPWSAQMTYFRGLRPRMDYATGVVGLKCGISRQMIKEELTVPSIQGRRLDAHHQPSTKEIRYALEVLEECGLIERIEAGKKLVFRMPYAAVGNSVQNMKGRSGAEQKNHINNKINHDEAAMKGRHLVSGKIEVLDTNSYTEASAPASVASPSNLQAFRPSFCLLWQLIPGNRKEKSLPHHPPNSKPPKPSLPQNGQQPLSGKRIGRHILSGTVSIRSGMPQSTDNWRTWYAGWVNRNLQR